MMLVSVVIPTHNRAALVREAIESVLNVRRDGYELEVIVVDDGSTDATPAVVAAYPIVYLRTEGLGAAAARNAGLRAAHGDMVAFLDDDDLWLPHNIAPQLAFLDQHPDYGAAYAQVQLTGPDRVPYGEPIPAGPLRSGWIFDELLTHWPQLGTLVVRMAAVRDVGYFDPTLRSEEEWDWILRIARRYPIGRIAQPVALFRQRDDNDEALAWRRLPDTIKVFHRHTRHAGLYKRIRTQRVIWAHRGWFATHFLHIARRHASSGARGRAIRTLYYALRASPFHAIKALTTSRPRQTLR